MTTIAQIKEAILALKDRTGSSIAAINKWLETEKKVSRFDVLPACFRFSVPGRTRFFCKIFTARQSGSSEYLIPNTSNRQSEGTNE